MNPHQEYLKSFDHLHSGRYNEGFRLFEYRWHPEIIANLPSEYPRYPKHLPTWQGESLLNKSIVVQVEQGYGDVFMFARFLPALKVMGAKKVVVVTQQSLMQILGQMECIDVITNLTETGPVMDCDLWIGAMSLPNYIFHAMPYVKQLFPIGKKIVGSEGYFDVEPSNIPKKIGVNWEASKNKLHLVKSIKDTEMLDLVGDDAYSLHPETNAFWSPLPEDGWKTNWYQTAKHMKAMKGVVTVDTGTAHLAGALGVKTIVLLPEDEYICWRWKNSSWYDSVICLRKNEYDRVPELIRRM